MSKIAVLDDNTRDANVIGYASTEIEAAEVYRSYHAERMTADEMEDMVIPTFAYRGDNSAVVPSFEPLA